MKVYDDDGTEMTKCNQCEEGRLITECCNGSSGCSCRGEPVDLGLCRVCNGQGWIRQDSDRSANLAYIRLLAEGGRGYLGSGPNWR